MTRILPIAHHLNVTATDMAMHNSKGDSAKRGDGAIYMRHPDVYPERVEVVGYTEKRVTIDAGSGSVKHVMSKHLYPADTIERWDEAWPVGAEEAPPAAQYRPRGVSSLQAYADELMHVKHMREHGAISWYVKHEGGRMLEIGGNGGRIVYYWPTKQHWRPKGERARFQTMHAEMLVDKELESAAARAAGQDMFYMPFGRHKGKPVQKILATDRQYAEWVARNFDAGDIRDAFRSALQSE